ncbi:MAG: hypothetical protein Q8P18_30835 [Pseudomonadota bacterium]|nr:hypothetical protein [Pseudomonadota bacterium]
MLRAFPGLVFPAVLPLALALLSAACTGEAKDTGSDAPPINQDDTSVVTCAGTAPVASELVVENYGLYPFEDGDAPALKVAATGTDDDGDLHRMDLVVWWDDVVDGAVDTSGEGTTSGIIAMDPDPCGTFAATYALLFEVDGIRFDYATAYEFAAEVYDDAGLVSGQIVADGVTPNMDGSDG